MDRTEKQVIDELFDKLGVAEQQSGARDREAESLIQQHLVRQPAAPYYMAQAIVFQEEALRQAQQRIQQLESELAQRPAGGGFLAGLFGGGDTHAGRPSPRPSSRFNDYQGRGGFLGGAMQTAMGIAGGMMLGSFLHSMITGGNEAVAAEAAPADMPPAEEPPADAGFDSGWDGGFDDGGGFDF